MQILSSSQLGAGFGQVQPGTPIYTWDQWLRYPQAPGEVARWVLVSSLTGDKRLVNDMVAIRRALTWRAKLGLVGYVPAVLGKVWRLRIGPLFAGKP